MSKSTVSKMNPKKTNKKQQNINYVLIALSLMIGLVLGYFASDLLKPKTASPEEIEQAKNEIVELYKDRAVDACWRVNDGEKLAADKYELTYRNIQINSSADRAIITDCAEASTLLAKTSSGNWIATNVNITNFNRVNPSWQKECGIESITVADDETRPENSSIDERNLAECKKLNQK